MQGRTLQFSSAWCKHSWLCCRFGILQEVAAASEGGGRDSALELVHQLLSETLYVLHSLLLKGHQTLVLPLAQVSLKSSALPLPS